MLDHPSPPPSQKPEPRLLVQIVRGWRVALARQFKVTSATRTAGVRAMIERHGKDRIAYWFQLFVSVGIATYGLVLGSTGVVIGAMLVSPLMGPIIEIGMGLVTGSPILVLYAGVRTSLSVALVVAGSALLTLGVPYYELNPEILARTAPTLIDLYVACFCALAAAYTTVRQSSDTISAAAGTAISIALVPPLCVVGWGLGSAHYAVSRGAAMLFVANFFAILLFAVFAFFLLAYDTVDIEPLENEGATSDARLHRFGSRLRGVFGSRYAPLLRLGMPLLLVASIYVPLRRALEEVAIKVKIRDGVQRALSEVPGAKQAVRTNITVDAKNVVVRLVIVGDSKAANKIKAELAARITATTSISPMVDVVAVPGLDAVRIAMQPVEPVVPQRGPLIPEIRRDLDEEMRHWWPTGPAGALASWSLVVEDGGKVRVDVVHFGVPLGAPGETLLASTLRDVLGVDATIRDVALPTESVEAPATQLAAWSPKLTDLVNRLVPIAEGYLCVIEAEAPAKAKRSEANELLRQLMQTQLQRLGPGRVTLSKGESFRAQISPTQCPRVETDGGAADANVDARD